ncbi:type I restriction endonuclease [Planctellipticum variicoloris]|jgi:type I restriction enzyme R subunit|nr:type I restriction endonuclease [Planctomycetaceae bacterium SH412]
MTVDKTSLSETDICTQFITPALQQAGWDFSTQVRQEVNFTAGQILVQGKTVKRGDKKRADYVLSYRENLRIGVVEAKDNTQAVGAGMQQALSYAAPDALDLPFVFSSNGDGFLFHDKTAKPRTTPKS